MANIKSGGQKFTSIADFENYTSSLVKQAQENTLVRLRKALLREMKEYIYDTPEGWYKRTKDLYSNDSWEIVRESVTKRKNNVESRASLQPIEVTHNADLFQHATPYQPKDIKWTMLNSYDLINLINNGVPKENSLFGEIEARPFWDSFLEYANKNYSRIFREECKKLGLELIGRSQGTNISTSYDSFVTKYK